MPEAEPPAEDTLILDPGASLGTARLPLASEATQAMDPGAGEATQILAPEATPEARVAQGIIQTLESGTTQPLPSERVREAQIPEPPRAVPAIALPEPFEAPSDTPGRAKLWIGAGLAAALAAFGFWWVRTESEPAPAPLVARAAPSVDVPVPPSYQGVHDRAKGGDVAAMRTLGAVFYYGLGTRAHPEEGLRWYRRAAEAGSPVAREELRVLEAEFSRQRPARP